MQQYIVFLICVPVSNAAILENSAISPQTLIELTNKERILKGRIPLKESSTLDEVAKLKVENMTKIEYFAHVNPEGKTPWYWFKIAGYKYTDAGENLAVMYDDADSVIKSWIDSPTHRANILEGKFTEIGTAVARGVYEGVETNYIVEVFGNKVKNNLSKNRQKKSPSVSMALNK
ncbi:MAG: CAP domain-containing protein [bacterium]